jgi:multiple sugar transport system ATP-binding protein
MARLTLDTLTKRYQDENDSIVAVDEVSLDIEDGEFLVLVGPSGCGKSTTLRMVAGLEDITEGAIRIDGESINDHRPQHRDIAMVFQSYALYPHMTVRENMRFGLEESTELSDDEIDDRVRTTATTMEIDDLLGRKPADLSGGQQQRVALGRAIVRDPAVFLLDEPLANLDAKLRAQMRTELQRLQEDLGVTTIYVTHDQTEAMTMGDRIAILDGGELQQVATPLEAYHQPTNRFVAGFIGEPSMNFFDVTVEEDRLVGDEFTYPIAAELQSALGDRPRVTLGVRPEDIEVDASGADRHRFETVVDVVEPLGDEKNLYLAFAAEADASFVARVDGMRRFEEGQRVTVHVPESSIHVFDAESGDALHNRELPTEDVAAPDT